MNLKSILLASILAFSLYFQGSSQITINELQLNNKGLYADEYAEYPSWVEFYNSSNAAVKVKGYYLTDDSNNRTQWKFPDITIAAKKTILVFLSGRDQYTSTHAHTNFSVKPEESLYLYNASSKLLDQKKAATSHYMMSLARIPDGSTWTITDTPTPNASNNGKKSYTAFLNPPEFAVASGLVKSGINVKISTTQANCIIRYTKNGDVPTNTSPIYKALIKVTADVVIRAACFDTSKTYFTSTTTTNTYITNNKTFKLPIVSVTCDSLDLWDPDSGLYTKLGYVGQEKRASHIEYMLPSGKLMFEVDADLSIHGNGSRSMAKKSFRVETSKKYDSSSIDYKLFPFRYYTNITSFNLRSGSQDQSSMMRDELTNHIMVNTNVDVMEHQSCVVFLNGAFWGIYHIREKEDNHYLENNRGVNRDSLDLIGISGVKYGDYVAYSQLMNIYSYSFNTQAKIDSLNKYLDLKNYYDYMVIETFIHNNDWPGNNTKLWAPHLSTGGKFRYVLYDTDYGTSDTSDKLGPVLTANTYGMGNIMQVTKFKNDFVNRYADLLNTTLSQTNYYANIAYIKNNLSYDFDKEATRWGTSVSSWDNAVSYIQSFVTDRLVTARNHIQSNFNLAKQVTLTLNVYPSNAGVVKLNTIIPSTYPWKGIYFDGVPVTVTAVPNPGFTFDSMVVNGASFTSKSLTKNLTQTANTINFYFNGTARTSKIAISEINYNCNDKLNSGNWIELHNYDTVDMEMTGYKVKVKEDYGFYEFKDNYILPANGYVVICEDTALFKKAYPSVTKRLGNIGFSLDNHHDSIILIDNKGKSKYAFVYNDTLPWPESADGTGRTWELKYDSLKPNFGTSWFNGCIGGSPGRAYSPCQENIIITEINYNSKSSHDDGEWVEIYNTSSSNITLTNWHFKDGDDLHDYTFPSGTILKSHEYLVLYNNYAKFIAEHPTVTNIIGPFNFGLSNNGEHLRLFDSKLVPKFSMVYHNELYGWPLKADGGGYTLELDKKNSDYSDKINWILGCKYGSPGKERDICPEDVVLVPTEINYNPLTEINAGDWIELKNTSKDTLDINNWILKTTNQTYNLPNINILPKSYIIIAEDTNKLYNAFPNLDRNKVYQINLSLNDTTDNIMIFDTIDIKRFEMYYIADSNDKYANGNGYTLELQQIPNTYSEYSIPANWRHGCFLGNPLEFGNTCDELINVSEINFNGDSLKKTADWLELYNYGSRPINLKDYSIVSQNASDSWNENLIFYPQTRMLITSDSNNIRTSYNLSSFQMNINLGQNDVVDINNLDHSNITKSVYDSSTILYANGLGKTLESTVNTNYSNNQALWKEGCFGGSPGVAFSPCSQLDLVVSEINYKSVANFNTGNWFELLNIDSAKSKDISNYYISFGDVTNIAQMDSNTALLPSTKTVFVTDTNAFKFYFPFQMNKLFFSKNIVKEGWVRIWDNSKNPVFVMKYDNTFGGNGNGRTLSLTNSSYVLNDYSNKQSWEEGCIGGSPENYKGWCDTTLLVSEINYQSSNKNDAGDWLEIINKTSHNIDLQGLYIYDSKDKQYILSGGLIKDSMLVFTSDSTLFANEHPECKRKINLANLELDEKGSIRIFGADKSLLYLSKWDYTTPWNDSADGKGYTLEYDKQYTDFSDAGTWFIGCLGGSPGRIYAADCYVVIPVDTTKNGITNKELLSDIYIAPNPTTGIFTVYFGSNYSNNNLVIYDAKGAIIYTMKNSGLPQQSIDLSGVERGIYFMVIIQDNKMKTLKFVKE